MQEQVDNGNEYRDVHMILPAQMARLPGARGAAEHQDSCDTKLFSGRCFGVVVCVPRSFLLRYSSL